MTSRSSGFSVTIVCFSMALRTAGQAVAQPGRPLVLLAVGRGPHLLFEVLDDGLGVAVEELDQPLHQPLVLPLVDLAHARSGALLDVEEEAGPAEALVVAELVVAARADRERAQEEVERLPDGVGVGVGTEVLGVLALLAPHDHGPGPLVAGGDGEEGVALVVPQADVEPGPVLLDEVVLEHEGLDVVADLDPLHRLGRGHHLGGAGRQRRRGHEVVRQARPQAVGLAHVDDPAVLVLELVRPGGVGNGAGRRTLEHAPSMVPILNSLSCRP